MTGCDAIWIINLMVRTITAASSAAITEEIITVVSGTTTIITAITITLGTTTITAAITITSGTTTITAAITITYNNNFGNDYNNSGYNNNFVNDYNNSGYNNNFVNDYNNNGYNNNFGNDYNNNGYNNNYGNNYNNSGKSDPNIPDYIYAAHPDARIATKKDGKTELIISTIICILVFLIFGFLMFQSWLSISETDRIMNCNVTVEGTVTNTWSSLRSSGKSKRTVYFATYKYTYNNTEYKGTVETGISRYHKGYSVTVYVDPDKPYDSRLFRESNLWNVELISMWKVESGIV